MDNNVERKAFRELSEKESNDYFDENQEYQVENNVMKRTVL
jgi:hypothetical protein